MDQLKTTTAVSPGRPWRPGAGTERARDMRARVTQGAAARHAQRAQRGVQNRDPAGDARGRAGRHSRRRRADRVRGLPPVRPEGRTQRGGVWTAALCGLCHSQTRHTGRLRSRRRRRYRPAGRAPARSAAQSRGHPGTSPRPRGRRADSAPAARAAEWRDASAAVPRWRPQSGALRSAGRPARHLPDRAVCHHVSDERPRSGPDADPGRRRAEPVIIADPLFGEPAARARSLARSRLDAR